jgi:hypothetical protein
VAGFAAVPVLGLVPVLGFAPVLGCVPALGFVPVLGWVPALGFVPVLGWVPALGFEPAPCASRVPAETSPVLGLADPPPALDQSPFSSRL